MIWCPWQVFGRWFIAFLLEAGQPHSVLTWYEVLFHCLQISLKGLSTLPPIFTFKNLSEQGFACVIHAKRNKSLLGIRGTRSLALEVITWCPFPAADSAVGNVRFLIFFFFWWWWLVGLVWFVGFFGGRGEKGFLVVVVLLPRGGLAHKVGRENIENKLGAIKTY